MGDPGAGKAVLRINCTVIVTEYEEIKEGRKVAALRFRIAKNPRADIPDALRDDPRLARLVTSLTAQGMAEDAARAIVQAHEPELVEWATTDLARRIKGKEKIENPAGWLRKAIKEDWRPQPTLFTQEQALARQADREDELQQHAIDQLEAGKQRLRNAEEKDAILRHINSLSNDERKNIEDAFRRHLADSAVPVFIANKFKGNETWIADPIIKRAAFVFLKDH